MNARHEQIRADVQALLDKGIPLPSALEQVQRIEHAADLADGLDYGPFLNVAKAWEERS